VLGFAAFSLLCWQSLADDRRRILSLAGLSASLAAALASHYYAVLIFVPLVLGEGARTIVRRRLDPWVWLAFAVATIPLWVFLPLIQSGRQLSGTFWAKPRWFDPVLFYQDLLALTASGAIFSSWGSSYSSPSIPLFVLPSGRSLGSDRCPGSPPARSSPPWGTLPFP